VTDWRSWVEGLWIYFGSYSQTRLHALAIAGLTLFIGLGFIHPAFILVGVLVYIGPPVYLYHQNGIPDDNPDITVQWVPTKIVGGNREPDTEAMRNSEVRFNSGEATIHSSVQIPPSVTSFRIRFSTPTHVVRAELNGAPEAEQTYDPMENVLWCENITVYGFDPIIRLYETEEDALASSGDYYLRIFNDEDDELLTEIRLVSR
jgi:hypothetical protein